MKILNFSHPLTEKQKNQIKKNLSISDHEWSKTSILDISCYLDMNKMIDAQVKDILSKVPMNKSEWKTEQILIVPPPISASALLILVGIFGICGYFPPVIRRKKLPRTIPPVFAVAEIMDVNTFFNQSRSLLSKN